MLNTNQTSLLVILGSPNDANGKLLPFALSRCCTAFFKYQELIDAGHICRVICTGGFGEHFNTTNYSHSSYLKEHLIRMGISATCFLSDVESRFTFEDACMCNEHFKSYPTANVIVVSSDFHMERVRFVFNGLYPHRKFEYLASESDITLEQREALISHEQSVMKREASNLANFRIIQP